MMNTTRTRGSDSAKLKRIQPAAPQPQPEAMTPAMNNRRQSTRSESARGARKNAALSPTRSAETVSVTASQISPVRGER